VGRPRRRVRSCHGKWASTKAMTSSSTVSMSGSSCSVCALICCLDKSFEGKTEPDIVRRMTGDEFSLHNCDTATFVVSATKTFTACDFYTSVVRRSLRVIWLSKADPAALAPTLPSVNHNNRNGGKRLGQSLLGQRISPSILRWAERAPTRTSLRYRYR
jgi:hypothetical protein